MDPKVKDPEPPKSEASELPDGEAKDPISTRVLRMARSLMAGMDETLWEGKYLTVKLLDGWYEYLHDQNGRFVAVLGYRREGLDGWYVLGRYETCPPHRDGIALCALTGGIEEGETPEAAAVRELGEESGIIAEVSKLEALGTIRPSKASDSIGYLFAIDLTNIEVKDRYIGGGDGTRGEVDSYCSWVGTRDAIASKDPMLATMTARKHL
jgi:hypothetical protein